jgi:predicted AAA+ superfamily ATPase
MVLELLRYCRGERDGVSILIAGQRGAGKTTLVKLAIERVVRDSDGSSRCRYCFTGRL